MWGGGGLWGQEAGLIRRVRLQRQFHAARRLIRLVQWQEFNISLRFHPSLSSATFASHSNAFAIIWMAHNMHGNFQIVCIIFRQIQVSRQSGCSRFISRQIFSVVLWPQGRFSYELWWMGKNGEKIPNIQVKPILMTRIITEEMAKKYFMLE